MSKGKRYDGEPKLNMKKVFAVFIAIAVIIMFVIGIKKLMTPSEKSEQKQVALKYLPVYTNDKWGVINSSGDIVIEPTYAEAIIIPDSSKAVFICTYDVDYTKGTYKTKVLDEKGSEIITGYDSVEAIENYDSSNTMWYESGVLKVKKDGKYGVLTINGETVIEPTYEEMTFAFTNTYIAKKDGKYGMIDITNQEKLPFEYESIIYDEEADFIRAQKAEQITELLNRNFEVKQTGIVSEINTSKNYIRIRVNDDYKYYNFKLEEKENTEILSTNTIFLSKKNGKYGYVNSKGIVVVDYIYDDATEQNKYGYVAVKKDGKWGCLNQSGKVIVEPTYKMENNLYIDFIDGWYLAEDLNANYYTK